MTEDTKFGYDGTDDSPEWSQSSSGGSITTYLGDEIILGSSLTYQISNAHGDITGTMSQSGVFTANPAVDEFGVASGITSNRLGWLGSQERLTVMPSLGLIRMGVRLYDPNLGRFLESDPVAGGSCNDYDYACADPVNGRDIAGTYRHKKHTGGVFWLLFAWRIRARHIQHRHPVGLDSTRKPSTLHITARRTTWHIEGHYRWKQTQTVRITVTEHLQTISVPLPKVITGGAEGPSPTFVTGGGFDPQNAVAHFRTIGTGPEIYCAHAGCPHFQRSWGSVQEVSNLADQPILAWLDG